MNIISTTDIFGWLLAWDPIAVGNAFLDTMAIIFLFALLCLAITPFSAKLRRIAGPFQHLAPTLLTTMGILGTFLGVSLGLARFDVSAIDASVPHLLEGMKTAFITSLWGVFLSILLKLFQTVVGPILAPIFGLNHTAQGASAGPGPQDIHKELRAHTQRLDNLVNELSATRNALAGEDSTTVVTQIQKLRTDLNDAFKTQNTTFSEQLNLTRTLGEHLANLHQISQTQNTTLDRQLNATQTLADSLDSIHQALGADGDTPLTTRITTLQTTLRSELVQSREEMNREFRAFAEQVSKLGSESLIEALRQVISDFNTKLSEQFGENFKQLNEAVGQLVSWQDTYKNQLTQMQEQFDLATRGITQSEQSIGQITQHTAQLPEHLGRMHSIFIDVEGQALRLEALLQTYADMRDKAANAMPEIRQRIDEVTEAMRESVKKASEHYEVMLTDSTMLIRNFRESGEALHHQFFEGLSKAVDNTTETLNTTTSTLAQRAGELVTHTEKHLSSTLDKLDHTFKQTGERLQTLAERSYHEQNERMQQLYTSLRKHQENATAGHQELLNQSLRELDNAMQQELQRALQLFANNLGSISEKFTRDYRQLTEQMAKVVRQNERLRGDAA